ncbi:MAG: ferrous iron transport protein B [Bacteroidetes bacterium GWF2_43_63]|nr:MAG: ferrous iron transport protein B [Bacteroidetes bacterium GWE2_42_42]OFY53906.1 MAG: ferrous iron transport protein B [Bacteroidetes bacterium GWF2_43_63]HBG69800.1 ferrous iron transport protein B [Bacteroidales bacterium]HCB61002.1 ferrous iron transport protein B [Bacteroidales bacterium]HCY24558.1 ferrous iron transport protein B [Bacteroidales bacterium]
MKLSELNIHQSAVIVKVTGHGAFRKRITEMGFVKGKTVRVVKKAPLKDPVEYEIMGYHVSLRLSEAGLIEVVGTPDADANETGNYLGTITDESLREVIHEKSNTIRIALVGNPNCGKTTLFNFASGSHEHVGNYGGVTVDSKEATIRSGDYRLKVTDLPGTYSITEYTPEELFVRNHILENMPDVVVNVIDASNLERNLFLTTQLIDMNIKVVIALNMYDELEQKGVQLNHDELGKLIGIPVVPTVAVKGHGVENLISTIIQVFEDQNSVLRHIHINYGPSVEEAIMQIQRELKKNRDLVIRYSTRYLSVKLIENDQATLNSLKSCDNFDDIEMQAQRCIQKIETEFREKSETILTDAKYGFIAGALAETCIGCSEKKTSKKWDPDNLLTHKIWGFPVFMIFMWLMFQATFTIGSYPMDWIDAGVAMLSDTLSSLIPSGAFHDLLIDGIIGGVGGVIIFLPNILILFFFISMMEDTGYMARVSFIMDKLMHKIGLHGKSFIPLLMGFGCNVPAIMATRTLGNRKDRIMTMLITPFMSCSARLPVYVLIISAFFTQYQGLVLFSVYAAGVILAIVVALILKNTIFSKQDIPFVMELPPYRIPTLKNTTRHMWFKGAQYLKKMGTVILIASILIWALGYYPRHVESSVDYDGQIAAIEVSTSVPNDVKADSIATINLMKASEHQEKSYIGQLGHFIEPVIRPLGFDWKIGVSLITGLAAKEIVVGSMGVLYQIGPDEDASSQGLIEKLQNQVHSSGELQGQKVFTPIVAFGFMLFILIYFPCIAVIAAIRKESNWGWAVFTMVYTTALAWLVAFAVYQVGNILI